MRFELGMCRTFLTKLLTGPLHFFLLTIAIAGIVLVLFETEWYLIPILCSWSPLMGRTCHRVTRASLTVSGGLGSYTAETAKRLVSQRAFTCEAGNAFFSFIYNQEHGKLGGSTRQQGSSSHESASLSSGSSLLGDRASWSSCCLKNVEELLLKNV